MLKISGSEIAQKIIERLKSGPAPKKILAAVLVGKDPASLSFIKQKEKTAKELGVDFRLYEFDEKSKNDDLREEIVRIANQKTVSGVIVQLPLPDHLNRHYILNAIPREKDVDVLGERALGAFYTGRNSVLPPAVGVVEEILKSCGLNLKSIRVAVVGLGFLVGKPIAHWLMGQVPELYLLDIGSDLGMLKNADLIITGVGKAGLIKPEILKEGASVIDFGYSMEHGTWDMEHGTKNGKPKTCGDFDASSFVLQASGFYTPTPGGTGPILVAKLFENFYKLILLNV